MNFAAAIETFLVFQPVQEVAHDGGMIPPPARRRPQVVVAIEETDPVSCRVAPRQTNEFGAEPRNNDAQAAFLIRQDVEQSFAAQFFLVRELHCRAMEPRFLSA